MDPVFEDSATAIMPIFLYTDIEGSTQLWERYGQTMGAVLDRHDQILLNCVEGCGGQHVKNTGDGMMVVFNESDTAPLECALAMQRRLADEKWPDIEELRIRVAIHAGPAEFRADDYYGPTVNRLARLLATAWGGQIILTPEVVSVTPLPEGASLEDLGVHLLKDLTEPQQVYGLVHAALPLQEFPALRSISSHPNNLPRQPTPLVGREGELVEISNLLLRSDCRLLTLVAPGGMGKTRLGLQAAAEQIDHFRHGVFFVPLAGVTIAENLPAAIVGALNLPFHGAEELEKQLHSYLREKQLLLLLDNFEHLIDGADTVANILADAPGVKILVTSRQRLRLQAEWTSDVAGLPVPGNGRLEAVSAFGAVELFLQSARRVQPDFNPSAKELRAIARVCRLVEGMPLALELAAAWVSTLSCDEIAAEIEQDLDLLGTEMRDVPRRQRSIRAIFDHSWNGLSSAEASAFKQLSVFRGGFNRAAAQKVAGATIRIMSALINKALLTRDESGRFQIHELIRQYAAEKLDENEPDALATGERHATYFATYLKTLEEPLIKGERTGPIEKLDAELDNVLLAWRWAIEHKSLSLLEDGMRTLFWFYEAKAWYSEGEEAFGSAGEALSSAGGTNGQENERLKLVVINLLARQAWFASRLSRYSDARAILPAGAELLFQEEDLEGYWIVAGTEINTRYGMGDFEAARRYLERYDERHEREHDYRHSWPWSKAQTLANLGRIASALGEYDKARGLLEDGLAILRPLGDQVSVILYLHTLGGVVRSLGDRGEARRLFQESLELAEAHSYLMGESLALSDLGDLDYEEGAYEAARQRFQSSLSFSKEIGDSRGRALALTSLGRVATALGEYDEAVRLYEQGLDISKLSGNRRGTALTLVRLSKVYQLLGNLDRAEELCQESRVMCRKLGYRKGEILAMISCSELILGRGVYQEAEGGFQESLVASQDVRFVSGAVQSLIGLGRTNCRMGRFNLAEDHLKRALSMSSKGHLQRAELSALVALAEVLAGSGALEQGLELFALVAGHPSADQYTRDSAASQIEGLKDNFSPADFENILKRGRAQTLEAVLEARQHSA
jgi:predicted ATPase/class 3 adenylate cyclase